MKRCYIVIFELSNSATTRAALIKRLRAYGTFCPLTKQSWAIVSEQTAAQVRDNLKEALETSDRLYVFRSGTEGAWRNSYGTKYNEWLKKYL